MSLCLKANSWQEWTLMLSSVVVFVAHPPQGLKYFAFSDTFFLSMCVKSDYIIYQSLPVSNPCGHSPLTSFTNKALRHTESPLISCKEIVVCESHRRVSEIFKPSCLAPTTIPHSLTEVTFSAFWSLTCICMIFLINEIIAWMSRVQLFTGSYSKSDSQWSQSRRLLRKSEMKF